MTAADQQLHDPSRPDGHPRLGDQPAIGLEGSLRCVVVPQQTELVEDVPHQ